MQFSLNDYLRYLECPKKFINYYRETLPDFSVVDFDDECTTLVQEYLGCYDVKCSVNLFDKDLLHYGWYHDIYLETKRFIGKVDWLYASDKGVTLYFISLHTFPTVRLKNRITCIVYLCNVLEISIQSIEIIYFNKNYSYDGCKYAAKKIFKKARWLTNAGFDFRLYPKHRVNIANFEESLTKMEATLTGGFEVIGNGTCKEQICALHVQCDKDRLESFDRRIIESFNQFGLPKQQLNQIQTLAVINRQNYCDKKALKKWLSQIQFPLNFFDFEWERKILPWVKGQPLFNDYVFEYSLVKIEKDLSVSEKVFIVEKNNNQSLFEQLICDFDECGSIFAYNANGAEIMQLKRFGELHPNYNEKIYKIIERIISIDVPLTTGMIYHLGIKGSYSLKNIAQLISFNDYATIECQTGLDAVRMYRQYLSTGSDHDYNALVEYCKADSKAMVALLKWYQDNACD